MSTGEFTPLCRMLNGQPLNTAGSLLKRLLFEGCFRLSYSLHWLPKIGGCDAGHPDPHFWLDRDICCGRRHRDDIRQQYRQQGGAVLRAGLHSSAMNRRAVPFSPLPVTLKAHADLRALVDAPSGAPNDPSRPRRMSLSRSGCAGGADECGRSFNPDFCAGHWLTG